MGMGAHPVLGQGCMDVMSIDQPQASALVALPRISTNSSPQAASTEITLKMIADSNAAAGTVMTQAAAIVMTCDRRTSFLLRRSSRAITAGSGAIRRAMGTRRCAYHSRKNPTPKTPPTAIWVELTGSPSQLAKITVIAADKATQ